MSKDNFLHCWADEASQYETGSDEWAKAYAHGGGTCLLPFGHDGPHFFTPGDGVIIRFLSKEEWDTSHTAKSVE